MIKTYYEFINESIISKDDTTTTFVISDKLYKILEKISRFKTSVGTLAKLICKLNYTNLPSTINFLDLTEESDKISFIKTEIANKIIENELGNIFVDSSEYQNLFSKLNKKNPIKIGKILQKLVELYNHKFKEDIQFTNKDIELFVNEFKSNINLDEGKLENFKLVNGTDIAKYYNESSYSSSKGTLGSSCMRYEESQDYLDLYTSNKESVSLLVYLDENDKVLGRALIWNLVDNTKFMDRVYTNYDSDVNLFIYWAKENKVSYKEDQDSYSNTYIYSSDDNYKTPKSKELTVKVRPYKKLFYLFPYLDTLKLLYYENGILSNRLIYTDYYVQLVDTDGDTICEKCENDGWIWDEDEGDKIDCYVCGNFKNKKF